MRIKHTINIATSEMSPEIATKLARYEPVHRERIAEIDKKDEWTSVSYYKDSFVDPGILHLVTLLNNKWTFSTHACEGHWPSQRTKRFDPYKLSAAYVAFHVLPGKYSEWKKVQDRVLNKQQPLIAKHDIISVDSIFNLPDLDPSQITWRFAPIEPHTILQHFPTEKKWREAMDRILNSMCRDLESEIAKA